MSKHTRSKKGRSASRYKERLAARGLSRTPRMPDFGLDIRGKRRGADQGAPQ